VTVRFEPSGPLTGTLRTAADKSISHRCALFAAMADGTSRIEGYLRAADTDSTLAAVAALGAGVEADGGQVTITGVGLRGVQATAGAIDVGNSGTLMRLLAGWLAGQGSGSWAFDGDESIRKRPVDRVADPLSQLGASIETSQGLPPFTVHGTTLHSAAIDMAVASAQVKSAILIAGLLAEGRTSVTEVTASRDHTERMLAEQGARITVVDSVQGHTVTIEGCDSLVAVDRTVPGDPSSAAFLLVAALLVPGSEVKVERVCLNPSRIGLFRILQRMGAEIDGLPTDDSADLGPEPIGDLTARYSSLVATTVSEEEVPSAIDELPLLALAACFARGKTVVRGAEELRVKETDRIETVVNGLSALGARIEARPDGFEIEGAEMLEGGTIDSCGDHRLAMLGAVAGLASRNGVGVIDFAAAGVSYPTFPEDIASLA
jgi:3-phosphoshikimate 1-carboxyvinyltransferase